MTFPIKPSRIKKKTFQDRFKIKQKLTPLSSSLLKEILKMLPNPSKQDQESQSTKHSPNLSSNSSMKNKDPKSKQEPRLKLNLDPDIKTQVYFPDRPQTSKGPRPFKYVDDFKKRKISFESSEEIVSNFKQIDRRAMISTSQSRRPSKTSKYNFQTSIGPEFLNLFAAN